MFRIYVHRSSGYFDKDENMRLLLDPRLMCFVPGTCMGIKGHLVQLWISACDLVDILPD